MKGCFICVISVLIIVFGAMEARALTRSEAVFVATHDHTCHVHLFNFDEDFAEYSFRVATAEADVDSSRTWQSSGDSSIGYDIETGVRVDVSQVDNLQIGQKNNLATKQCELVIEPGANGDTSIYHLSPPTSGGSQNRTLKVKTDLSFDCKRTLKTVSFKQVDHEASTAHFLAILTLTLYFAMRCVGSCREYACLRYDALYSPVERDTTSLFGRRIVWNRVLQVAIRPYLLFSVLPAQLLAPWTTIELHEECPQLIAQVGDPTVTASAVVLTCFVCFTTIANRAVTAYFVEGKLVDFEDLKETPAIRALVALAMWGPAIADSTKPLKLGRENTFRPQDLFECILCALVVALVAVSAFSMFPLNVIFNWRGLFSLAWPEFAVSRWSTGLRLLAAFVFLTDTVSFVTKLVVAHPGDIALELEGTDKSKVVAQVAKDPSSLARARDEWKRDKDVVRAAVEQSFGSALQHASEDLQADREFVLEAVKHSGRAVQHASEALKSDREFMQEAGALDQRAWEHASKDLWADRLYVMKAIQANGLSMKLASETLRADSDFMLEAMTHRGYVCEFAAESLRANRDFILKAMERYPRAWEHASYALKSDREVVLEAVSRNGSCVNFNLVSWKLRGDRDFMLEVVKMDGALRQHASSALKDDPEIAKAAQEQKQQAAAASAATRC